MKIQTVTRQSGMSVSHDAPSKNAAKRTQILEGSWKVFVEVGLAGASVDRLAEEAGVSKPTLYKYFESKEAIFLTLITEHVRSVEGGRFALDPLMGPPETLLKQVGIGFLTVLMQQRTLDTFRLLIAEAPRFPDLGPAFEAVGPARGQAALVAYLETLDQSGVLAIKDARLAGQQFMALCECGLLRRAHTRAERPSRSRIDRIVTSAVEVFLRGYARS